MGVKAHSLRSEWVHLIDTWSDVKLWFKLCFHYKSTNLNDLGKVYRLFMLNKFTSKDSKDFSRYLNWY